MIETELIDEQVVQGDIEPNRTQTDHRRGACVIEGIKPVRRNLDRRKTAQTESVVEQRDRCLLRV